MKRGAEMGWFILLILIALGLAVIGWRQESWDNVTRGMFIFFALFFLAWAFAFGLQMLASEQARNYRIRMEAEARTVTVLALEAAARLQPWQVQALDKFGPGIIAQIPDGYEPPEIFHTLNNEPITLDFIRKVVKFDGYEFITIRELDKADHEQAGLLALDFAKRGWVTPARGQNPARWLDKNTALFELRKIGDVG